jgi:hypothetical protein
LRDWLEVTSRLLLLLLLDHDPLAFLRFFVQKWLDTHAAGFRSEVAA